MTTPLSLSDLAAMDRIPAGNRVPVMNWVAGWVSQAEQEVVATCPLGNRYYGVYSLRDAQPDTGFSVAGNITMLVVDKRHSKLQLVDMRGNRRINVTGDAAALRGLIYEIVRLGWCCADHLPNTGIYRVIQQLFQRKESDVDGIQLRHIRPGDIQIVCQQVDGQLTGSL